MAKNYKLYLGGKWVDRKDKVEVRNPYDGRLVARVALATSKDMTKAIDAAEKAFAELKELPSHKRYEINMSIAKMIEDNAEKLAKTMVREMGKAYQDAMGEVQRAITTFTYGAEEAKRIGGDVQELDVVEGHEGRLGIIRRFPKGIVVGITPFNFPLNLVAHKVAPAIACGCPIIVKPADKTPIMSMMLAEFIDKTDLPKGAVSVLTAVPDQMDPLFDDERVKLISFTGSDKVGWMIKKRAHKAEVVLELGGNAGVAVADDADVKFAVQRVLKGAFGTTGQSCISVQRVFLHENIYDKFMRDFKKQAKKLKVGNPLDPKTDVGVMINEEAAKNTAELVSEAKKQGAKVAVGGRRKGATYWPTVLTNVSNDMRVCSDEAFAPIVVVQKYKDFKKVVKEIDNSRYGLQAGIFTNRINDIFYAFKHIEVGGLVINDVPTYRSDPQPYGGVKDSGIGREGLKYAIDDMTEIRILSLKLDTF